MPTDYQQNDQGSRPAEKPTDKEDVTQLYDVEDIKDLDRGVERGNEDSLFGGLSPVSDYRRVGQPELIKDKVVEKDCFVVTGAPLSGDNILAGIFIAIFPCEVVGFAQVHGTASSGACTIQLVKSVSGTTDANGSALLNTAMSLAGAAATPQIVMQKDMVKNAIRMKRGDRLAITLASGATTGLDDCVFQVYLKHAEQGDYKVE